MHRLYVILGLFALLGLTIWAVTLDGKERRAALRAGQDETAIRLDETAVVPTQYRLTFVLLPEVEEFSGTTEIDLTLDRPMEEILLNGEGLAVEEVSLLTAGGDSIAGAYEEETGTGRARIRFEERVVAGPATLTIAYRAGYSDTSSALFKQNADGETYIFSQMQPLDARRVFPSFDQPGFKTPFDISVITREGLEVISNGAKLAAEPLGRGLVAHQFASTPPLPTYLVAVAVGPFQRITLEPMQANGVRTTPLPIQGYAVRGQAKRMRFALEKTRDILLYLEEYFDSPFPYEKLDIVAVPDFALVGMENAGAIFLSDALLFVDKTVDEEALRRLYRRQGHELAHQWFGNYVTPKWWDDIWLNESFAVWMGDKVMQTFMPPQTWDSGRTIRVDDAMLADSYTSTRELRSAVRDIADVRNAFNIITFVKGAALLRMYERYLGAEQFRTGIRLYLEQFGNANADSDDFLDVLNQASGRGDLAASLSSFVYQNGLPSIQADIQCSVNQTAQVQLTQERYQPYGALSEDTRTWLTPVCLRYGPASQDQGRVCAMVENGISTVRLPTTQCPSWILPDQDGAGYYRWQLQSKDWLALIARADTLSRAELLSTVQNMVAAVQAGTLAFPTFLATVDYLATSAEAEILSQVLPFLRRLVDQLSDREERAGLTQFYRLSLGARLARMGYTDQSDERSAERRLRADLMELLGIWSDDQALRQQMAEQAVAVLERASPEPDNSLIAPLFMAGVLDFGAPFARAALSYAREIAAPDQREAILYALAHMADPETARIVQSQLLATDWSETERQLLLNTLLRYPELRLANWQWLENEADTILDRLTDFGRSGLLRTAANFCTRRGRDQVAAFFDRRASLRVEMGQQVAFTLEHINLCIALKDQLRPAIIALQTEG